jgi:hypothetical protein
MKARTTLAGALLALSALAFAPAHGSAAGEDWENFRGWTEAAVHCEFTPARARPADPPPPPRPTRGRPS